MKSKPAKLIPLPAASASKTALVINQRATDKELAELGHALAQVEGSRQWWLGDYGLELQRRKRAELQKLKPTLSDDELNAGASHYTAGRADALSIEAAIWHECVVVCRFYEPRVRTQMSFGHHRVAMFGVGGSSGDPKKALSWLLKAEENAWSVSVLRRELAEANATTPRTTTPPEENPFAPLDEADHWAISQSDATLTPEAAQACLTRWTALIAFLDRLRQTALQASEQRAEVGNH